MNDQHVEKKDLQPACTQETFAFGKETFAFCNETSAVYEVTDISKLSRPGTRYLCIPMCSGR